MSKTSRSTDRMRLGQFADLATDTVPEIPEDLSALTDDEVGTLHDELVAFYATASKGASSVDQVTALEPIVEAVLGLRALAAQRINGPAEVEAALAAHESRLAVAEPVVETPAATTEPEVPALPGDQASTEPVTASTTPRPAVPALPGTEVVELAPVAMTASGRPRHRQVVTPLPIRPAFSITAAGEIPGYTALDQMADISEIGAAILRKREAIGRPGANCGSDLITVASIHTDYDDSRHLRKEDSIGAIQEKLDGIVSLEALTASGGLCAPVQPYYDIMTIAEAARPVRDALATFQADRGGIRLIPPPQLSDAAGSVGFVTAAVDFAALGGNAGQISAATKPCLHVTCPGVQEYDVAAVTRCLEFGNITSRAYPEQVTAWTVLALAQHARKAETALIDVIASHSTQVTLAKVVGAARDVIAGIVKGAAYYRNHNRMLPDRPLRCMMPAWVIDLMIADLTHGSGYEAEFLAMARQEIDDALGELNINVSYYLDSGTGKGQLINSGNAVTAGALTAFPSTVVWYLFSEGSFLFLDAGTLDFGIVRDSTLNALNNYRIFAETFETAAFVGVESLEGTQTVVADGTAAGVAYGLGASTALPVSY